jgi:5'-3' exonuclease
LIALLDGDILVYECGFSSDSNAKKDGIEEGYEPLPFTLKIVKNKIDAIMEVTGANAYEVYLTGKDNFRLEIQPDYKANRDPNHKPHWYQEIKDYLIAQHDAVVVDGIEADDMLGIRQMTEQEDFTCICSKDKDLDCIPGFHYNWSPSRYMDGVYEVSEYDAALFFYTQCLTGDSTDNIPGIYKSTGKRATKKMKDGLLACRNELEMFEYVRDQYEDIDFTPIAQCLWIQREEGQIWSMPDDIRY